MLTHRERIPQGCSRQSKQTPAHEFFLPGHHLDRKHRQKIMIYFQVSIHDPISRGFPFWKSFGIFWLIEVEEGPRKYAITISKCFKSFRPTSFTASLSYKMFPAPNKIIPTPKQKNSPPPTQKKKIPESFFAVFLPQLLFTKQLKCPSRNEFFGFRMPQRKNLPGNEAFNGAKIQLWSCNGNSELKARPSSWWFRWGKTSQGVFFCCFFWQVGWLVAMENIGSFHTCLFFWFCFKSTFVWVVWINVSYVQINDSWCFYVYCCIICTLR